MQEASLGIITDENQRVLLVLRKDVPFWVLPGGGIEKDELPESACIREVCEETGLLITRPRHIATYSPINALTSTTYIYTETCPSHTELKIQEHEVVQAAFFSLDRLPSNIFFLHGLFLQDWQEASTYPFFRPLSTISYTQAFFFFCHHPIYSIRYLRTRIKNFISKYS